MPKLSEEEYVKTMGHRCPMCESPDIETQSGYGADSDYSWQPVKCNRCDAVWDDVYKLIGYSLKENNNTEW